MIIISSASQLTLQALYNSIVTSVYTLTGRADLVAETTLAVRRATMKAHMADSWKNDLASSIVTMPVLDTSLASFRYTLDLTASAIFPLYKKMEAIEEYNNPLTGQEIKFKELDKGRTLDSYLLEDINYWYQAGQQVSLRANKVLTYLAVTYYQYPNIVTSLYTSWIAQQFPDMIVCEAAANVFKTIGKDSEASYYSKMFEENLQLLRMSEI